MSCLSGSFPLALLLSHLPSTTKKHGLPYGRELARNIRRVLDDDSYYLLCGEEKVVQCIESVAADSDNGADNFLRSILTSLVIRKTSF
jgi:hypothetical protein